MAKLIIKNKYGVIPNNILNNEKLSFGAKGLYAYLQSKPANWRFSVRRMALQTKEGKASVLGSIKELEEAKFLKRKPVRGSGGEWNGYDYTLYETPFTDKWATVRRVTVKGVTLSKKDYSKKDIVNKSKNMRAELAGVNDILKVFYDTINPAINYGNKTSRKGCEYLIEKFGLKSAIAIAKYSCSVQGKPYSPTITTPYQLKEKLASLKIYKNRNGAQKKERRIKIL